MVVFPEDSCLGCSFVFLLFVFCFSFCFCFLAFPNLFRPSQVSPETPQFFPWDVRMGALLWR